MTPNWDAGLRALRGVVLGDSLGLPYEGLSACRCRRLYSPPLRQRLLFGTGFPSDDTALSAIALASLVRHPDHPHEFAACFARNVRTWFLAAPPGIGLSTIKASLRITLGVPASRSGVRSAGNGAAIRVAVLGAALHANPRRRVAMVEACARVTHTHPLAIAGAQLVALAAALSVDRREAEFDALAAEVAPDWPWHAGWPRRGPSAFVVPTVNAAIREWRAATSFESAIRRAVALGGDADSVAAIVGGAVAARPGALDTVPLEWNRVWGRPNEDGVRSGRSPSWFHWAGWHALQLPVILVHGFRRLLPPYEGKEPGRNTPNLDA